MKEIFKNLYEAFRLKRAIQKYTNELVASAAGRKALYRAHAYCTVQNIVLDDLVILTGLSHEEITNLQCRLEITLYQIRMFYTKLGFLPTADYAIGIKHLGLEVVIDCINKETKDA